MEVQINSMTFHILQQLNRVNLEGYKAEEIKCKSQNCKIEQNFTDVNNSGGSRMMVPEVTRQ